MQILIFTIVLLFSLSASPSMASSNSAASSTPTEKESKTHQRATYSSAVVPPTSTSDIDSKLQAAQSAEIALNELKSLLAVFELDDKRPVDFNNFGNLLAGVRPPLETDYMRRLANLIYKTNERTLISILPIEWKDALKQFDHRLAAVFTHKPRTQEESIRTAIKEFSHPIAVQDS